MTQAVKSDQSMFGVEGIGRGFVIGSLVGFVLTFAVTGGITLLAGAGVGPAVIVGVFAGAWGGPGFGGMLGLVGRSDRAEG